MEIDYLLVPGCKGITCLSHDQLKALQDSIRKSINTVAFIAQHADSFVVGVLENSEVIEVAARVYDRTLATKFCLEYIEHKDLPPNFIDSVDSINTKVSDYYATQALRSIRNLR